MRNLIYIINTLNKKEKFHILIFIILIIITSLIEAITINAVIPVLNILTGTIPTLNVTFLGNIFQKQNLEKILIIFSILIVSSTILKLITLKFSINISFNVGLLLSKKIIKNIIELNYEKRLELNDGEIIGTVIVKINDLIRNVNNLFNILTAVISITLITTILLNYNQKITFATIILFAIIYTVIFLISKKIITKNSITINNKINLSSQNIQEILTNFTDIKINNLKDYFENKFFKNEFELRKTQIKSTVIGIFPKYIIESTGLLFITILILYLNTNGVNSETIPLVGFLALSAQKILPYIQQAYTGYIDIKSNGSSFNSIKYYLDINQSIISKQYSNEINKGQISFNKSIFLDNVQYKYPNGKLSKKVNFEVKKGEKIGIIGKSGIGKTTLLYLMMGIIKPTSGKILIDNEVLDEYNVESWYNKISYVPQKIYLIEASIQKNIALGVDTNIIDHKRIKELCSISQIDHLLNINNKDNNKMNVTYSGGEIQRIAIARALYKYSEILFLDEITSSLDKEAEKIILDNIKNIKNKTIIMISHNIKNFDDFDKIINLDLC